MQYYDIIGDIHGHGEKLIALLTEMGYVNSDKGYCHPTRKVIFVGDFIDRGLDLKQHRLVLDTIMPMVNNGLALAVMGNHEFNALAYHTINNNNPLREHSNKNTSQHQAFLNEYPYQGQDTQCVLDFFMSLPLFLELDDLRVIHACWDQKHVDIINHNLSNALLDKDNLINACDKAHPLFDAVEVLLKGKEIKLPEGITFQDKDSNPRDAIRIQWWNKEATCLQDIVMPKNLDLGDAAEENITDNIPGYESIEKPCFIGHYWLDDKQPSLLLDNLACVDYSVAKDGLLVAYRWSGEQTLAKDNFYYIN